MSVKEASKAAILAARRGHIIRFIEAAAGFGLSAKSIQDAFDHLGRVVGLDIIKLDLEWLEDGGFVTCERDGAVTIAKLTDAGEDVALGRTKTSTITIERS